MITPKAEQCLKNLLLQNGVFYRLPDNTYKRDKLYSDWYLACEMAFAEEIQLPMFTEVSKAIKSRKHPYPGSMAEKIYLRCSKKIFECIKETGKEDHFSEDGEIICDDCTLFLQDAITTETEELWQTQYAVPQKLPSDEYLDTITNAPKQLKLF